MSSEKQKIQRENRNYFGPFLLIAIGLLFLASNLGVIPGNGWDVIWRLWPVLLIIGGLNDLIRREGIAWPILLIGAGVFFLLNNFGPRVWISWSQLIQLWPVLLIAAGIDILFRGESVWMTVMGVVLTVVLIGGAVWVVREGFQVAADYGQIREEYGDEIEEAAVELDLGAGEFLLGTLERTGTLVIGNITPDQKESELSSTGDQIMYLLKNDVPDFFPHTARWELDLTGELPVDLRLNNGVGEMILSLEGADLTDLDVNQGVGRLVVHLPDDEIDNVKIKQAVGVIYIQLPKGARIAIDAQNGLSKVNFPSDFELEDGYYVNPGTTRSNADLVIVVEQAIGLVNIQYSR
jgi:hypothetical protein